MQKIIDTIINWITPYIQKFNLPAPLDNPYVLLVFVIVLSIIIISSIVGFIKEIHFRKQTKKLARIATINKLKREEEKEKDQEILRQIQTQSMMLMQTQIGMMAIQNSKSSQPGYIPVPTINPNTVPVPIPTSEVVSAPTPEPKLNPTPEPVHEPITNAISSDDNYKLNDIEENGNSVETIANNKKAKTKGKFKNTITDLVKKTSDKAQDVVSDIKSKSAQKFPKVANVNDTVKADENETNTESLIDIEPEIIKDLYDDGFGKKAEIYDEVDLVELVPEVILIEEIIPDTKEEVSKPKYNLEDLQPITTDNDSNNDETNETDNNTNNNMSKFEKLKQGWEKKEKEKERNFELEQKHAEIIKINQQILEAKLNVDITENETKDKLTAKERKALEAQQKELEKRKKAALRNSK